MRGSDEPESHFYTCTKCGYKWREDWIGKMLYILDDSDK
jgi:hypothetical protein